MDSLRSKPQPSPAELAARTVSTPSSNTMFRPNLTVTCGETEKTWGLVCCRVPHQAGHHSGLNEAGTFEGYWGVGILHVNRIELVIPA